MSHQIKEVKKLVEDGPVGATTELVGEDLNRRPQPSEEEPVSVEDKARFLNATTKLFEDRKDKLRKAVESKAKPEELRKKMKDVDKVGKLLTETMGEEVESCLLILECVRRASIALDNNADASRLYRVVELLKRVEGNL